MVCTLGRGYMAAMVRLLGNGNYLEASADETCHEKLAAQTILREFNEADEANLLEEEDMHVFDSRPLVDPLHLVCCNACKKPVKASQYASHAERCRLINSTENVNVEFDGGNSHKKPPRKGRKKLQATHDNQGSTIGEQEKSEFLEGYEDAVSESNINDQTGTVSSFSRETKGGLHKQVIAVKSAFIEHQRDGQNLEHGRLPRYLLSDIPAPLATKIYHLRGNHRLRSALGHIYIEAIARDQPSDPRKNLVQDGPMVSEAPKVDISQAKKDAYPASAMANPDQILAQSLEVCLGTSGGYPPSMGFLNQLSDGSFPRPGLPVGGASVGVMRARYHPVAYSLPRNTGTALVKMQQPSGSVPVV
uniref:Ataxin-7-like protein 1 n=1 Tax=Anthurium amnicola TaxID=1678845 RepID=A0A1D1XPF6_9ARAE